MADKGTKKEDMIGDITKDEMLELLKNMLKAKEESNTYYGFEMYKKKPKLKKGGAVRAMKNGGAVMNGRGPKFKGQS